VTGLLARIAARKLAGVAAGQGTGEVQPVAIAPTGGIRIMAGRTGQGGNTDDDPMAPAVYTGAIRPAMPDLTGDRLKTLLDNKDRRVEASRVGRPGYAHVSTLCSDVCERHYVLNAVQGRIDFEAVTGGHRLMWKYGRAAEAHIRDNITDGDATGFKVYGQWKCACEASVHIGARPKQDKLCPTCQLPLNRYHEQPWFDHDNKIVGNPDLGLFIARWFFPVEIKSMTADQWDGLTEPLTEHINQALLYRYLAQKAGLLVHDKVLLVYAKKEFRWGSPYKVFDVDVTTARWVGVLERSLERAVRLRDAIAEGTPPPRLTSCSAIDRPRAKKCPALVPCFQVP